MKTNFLIPILALIFSIGMSFTSLEKDSQANDYVLNNGNWRAIPEQNCGEGEYTCQVKFGENGTPLDVYDEMDLTSIKESDSPIPTVINP